MIADSELKLNWIERHLVAIPIEVRLCLVAALCLVYGVFLGILAAWQAGPSQAQCRAMQAQPPALQQPAVSGPRMFSAR